LLDGNPISLVFGIGFRIHKLFIAFALEKKSEIEHDYNEKAYGVLIVKQIDFPVR
jgi:hypothetical protein